MNQMKWRATCVGLAGLIAASAMSLAFRDTLVVNGKSTTVDVRTIGGSAYVKLSDVARALDMTVAKRGEGRYELTKEGGANQIGTLTGKVGDTLFDGKWRFKVLSVDTADTYTMKSDSEPYGSSNYEWNRTTHLLKPNRGHTLVIIQCRIANAVKERRTLWTAISDDKIRTALTDDAGSSYPPISYDYDGSPTQTPWLLPGAQMTFPVIFSVPEGTKFKDLVFTLKNNQGDEKGVDVRVSLSGS